MPDLETGVVSGALGDLEFLANKSKNGDILRAEGVLNGVGNEITIIPANGKTFFLAGGNYQLSVGGLNVNVTIELQNDVTITETYSDFTGSASNTTHANRSNIISTKGDSLIGDGVKKYRWTQTVQGASGGSAEVSLFGWQEDT